MGRDLRAKQTNLLLLLQKLGRGRDIPKVLQLAAKLGLECASLDSGPGLCSQHLVADCFPPHPSLPPVKIRVGPVLCGRMVGEAGCLTSKGQEIADPLELPIVTPQGSHLSGEGSCPFVTSQWGDQLFFPVSFTDCTCDMWKFLRQGSNWSCSCGLHHRHSNTGSQPHL